MQYVIFKMFLRVDLKLSTLLFVCFVFVSFWTHVLCFTCNIKTWQSLSVGWAWLNDRFSRTSLNLCCLFQALSIEMCFTAEYLQRTHDVTWLAMEIRAASASAKFHQSSRTDRWIGLTMQLFHSCLTARVGTWSTISLMTQYTKKTYFTWEQSMHLAKFPKAQFYYYS